ncbi:hypothetical protein C8R44DRAFT_817821 [Mycena epipterygia]|nr:hypothetical protein C8R44DRAFT_817821 [Mycena epipterygia]
MHVQLPPTTTHVSDFARDFYATTSVPPGAFSDVSGARASSSSGGSRYPPPPAHPSQYKSSPGASPAAARTPSPSSGSGLPDDGHPIHTPVAGHLLRDGKMLVYPPHHECSKCNNTGYKHGDPLHPCSRCWSRYARPYAGALAYAPDSGPGAGAGGSTHASLSFRRPLPRIYGPPPRAGPSPSPGAQYGSQNGYGPSPNAPPNGPAIYNASPNGYPPPHASYPPGDPRLGGAPCWRCGGSGTLSFLIFETVGCSVCRGVGRVYG